MVKYVLCIQGRHPMNDFDALLVRVLDQARALKIPVSAQIR